ncbi:MAG: circadian clock protein LdpA [Xenococcaceae cyanobacterium]
MSDRNFPLDSLEKGNWFKLICGASFQDLSAVRNLALSYSLAGADCIDVAADPAVILAAKEGIAIAKERANLVADRGLAWKGTPWLMVSLNDGEDPHFRKAEFNTIECPQDCPRPCENICPANAITFSQQEHEFSGVIEQRCYGCGRCLPVCPSQLIFARSYVSTPSTIVPLIKELGIDAIEIHTQVGHEVDFAQLWQEIEPYAERLKLLAISCPDAPGVIEYLRYIYALISPLPIPLIWQTDGRPMSGDIGKGTTHAAIALAQKVLQSGLAGYIQLAGGTNGYTVTKLRANGLLKCHGEENLSALRSTNKQVQSHFIAGVAYGSYARSLLSPILEQLTLMNYNSSPFPMQKKQFFLQLENNPQLLGQAVGIANDLVSQLKLSNKHDLSANK